MNQVVYDKDRRCETVSLFIYSKEEPKLTQAMVKELVGFIDEHGENLTKWEIKFIAGLIDDPPGEYSAKQSKTVMKIYRERCL